MSTILEALKKSEQERKLNDVPTLSDMPVPQESARWPFYAIGLLSLLLALLAGVLVSPWFDKASPDQPATSIISPVSGVENTSVQSSQAEGVSALDEITVNVVSYSAVPEQRFVMLNSKMYRENDFVRAGLKVEEIKPNAVVLNVRGELLTRTP